MPDKPGAGDPPKDEPRAAAVESDDEAAYSDNEHPTEAGASTTGAAGNSKKKRSKRKKLKEAITGKSSNPEADLKNALSKLPEEQLRELINLNPALKANLEANASSSTSTDSQTALLEQVKRLKLEDIMTGLASSGKNVKDMADYKFWSTQPVPKLTSDKNSGPVEEKPIKVMTLADVPKEPPPMSAGYEWVTVDLTNPEELKEVYQLLNGHYVEDKESMFRFNYSASMLKWALMAPGWTKDWHVGVRTVESRKLVAFISAIPMDIRIRKNVVRCSEVNFLVVHKKLRDKRLAPVLIREVTRRSNLKEVWQGIYTAGIVLPKPVSTCRYYHRAINWQKLYECGFSPCPSNSKPSYQVRKYALPDQTSIKGLRELQKKDLPAVHDLLTRYLKKFDMALQFSMEEIEHWMMDKRDEGDEKVIYAYVVEDENKKITDFFSFYCLESTIINHAKHNVVRAAYLFYYATEVGLTTHVGDRDALKTRLNELIRDALIISKQQKFDVFNALTLMENNLFLEKQLFGAGDGQLHYYLFNYMANPIAGGVDKKNQLDMEGLSGIGLTML